MSHPKKAAVKAPKTPWTEKVFPVGFAPKPTVFPGGVDRIVRCFEELRDLNTGGYKGGFLKSVGDWGFKAHLGTVTSCSPFTGTVIAMMFDRGDDGNGRDPKAAHFTPTYDGDDHRPLPSQFYHVHNTSLPDSNAARNAGKVGWREALAHLKRIGVTKKPGLAPTYGSVGAVALWNLGYEIDPRDMRRGDHVHIDWSNGGGHAVFCWDVHLDASGAVDCFLFVSSNGGKSGGVGVSVGASPGTFFIDESHGKYTKKPEFSPLFVDRPEYVERGSWKILPGFGYSEKAIRAAKSFAPVMPRAIGKGSDPKRVHAIRFWGFPPPDRTTPRGKAAWADPLYATNFPLAEQLTRYAQPGPYSMGGGRAVAVSIPNVTAVSLRAEHVAKPEDLARVATKPVVQTVANATPEQLEVERALDTLFRAGLIEAGPGDITNVYDQDTVRAIRAFQRRWGLKEDGIAGRVTRPILFAAAADVRAGKTHTPRPPEHVARPKTHATKPAQPAPAQPASTPVMLGPVTGPAPVVERFYWLQNHAMPGERVAFIVEGRDLDVWNFSLTRVTLTERTRGTRIEVLTPVPFTIGGRGEGSIELPRTLDAGTVWDATLDCDLATGITRTPSPIALTITARPPAEPVTDAGGWPWDESLWPASMRSIVAELRATPRPAGPFTERWALSTYGVKEKMNSIGPRDRKTGKPKFADGGDLVPVLDKAGKEFAKVTRYSLFAADIEGTMRLGGRVLNIAQTGRARHGKPPHRYEEFVHESSRWHDVTDRHPWGSGSKVPLIPYRVLAINAGADSHHYRQKVYIKALDGMRLPPTGEVHNGICIVGDCGSMDPGRQFDFFKGRQDIAFKIDGGIGMFKNSKGVSLPLSEIAFLDACVAAQPRKKK